MAQIGNTESVIAFDVGASASPPLAAITISNSAKTSGDAASFSQCVQTTNGRDAAYLTTEPMVADTAASVSGAVQVLTNSSGYNSVLDAGARAPVAWWMWDTNGRDAAAYTTVSVFEGLSADANNPGTGALGATIIYKMRAYVPSVVGHQDWISVGTPSTANPSGLAYTASTLCATIYNPRTIP